jgi:hypothetical protein
MLRPEMLERQYVGIKGYWLINMLQLLWSSGASGVYEDMLHGLRDSCALGLYRPNKWEEQALKQAMNREVCGKKIDLRYEMESLLGKSQ